MGITRQLVHCWLLGAFWILCGLLIVGMHQFLPNYYRMKGPALSWHFAVKGNEFALLQINKGSLMESNDWSRFRPNDEIRNAFWIYKESEPQHDVIMSGGYWTPRPEGGTHKIAAVCIAGSIFVLPVSFECLLFVVGAALLILPSWLDYVKRRKTRRFLSDLAKNQ